jgi:hypothetical protein
VHCSHRVYVDIPDEAADGILRDFTKWRSRSSHSSELDPKQDSMTLEVDELAAPAQIVRQVRGVRKLLRLQGDLAQVYSLQAVKHQPTEILKQPVSLGASVPASSLLKRLRSTYTSAPIHRIPVEKRFIQTFPSSFRLRPLIAATFSRNLESHSGRCGDNLPATEHSNRVTG